MAKLEPPEGGSFLDGLEVCVAFGGVWKQSFSELSGGQRSLLALSLILALLLFKPAPLYILDEVARETNEELCAIQADPTEGFDVEAILSIERQLSSEWEATPIEALHWISTLLNKHRAEGNESLEDAFVRMESAGGRVDIFQSTIKGGKLVEFPPLSSFMQRERERGERKKREKRENEEEEEEEGEDEFGETPTRRILRILIEEEKHGNSSNQVCSQGSRVASGTLSAGSKTHVHQHIVCTWSYVF